ncbi:hypothetical protein TNCV_4043231 [Trichonephila clavipes]|nr:hypothetical protein TNCV_4043231 [Trichonephila clavipes]
MRLSAKNSYRAQCALRHHLGENPRIVALQILLFLCQSFSELQCSTAVLPFGLRTATAGSDVVQSGRRIFDDFFQHLWPYIGNNTANVVFQMVERLWLIRIDQ